MNDHVWSPIRTLYFTIPEQLIMFEALKYYLEDFPENSKAFELCKEFSRNPNY